MLVLAACVAAALGAPVVLGPDGPLRLGPTVGAEQPEVLVDPRDGSLWLEDGPRRFEGGHWIEGGTELQPPPAPAAGAKPAVDPAHVWDANGRLEATVDARGTRHRFLYDDASRLSGVLAGDGDVMQIRYDRDGHVREI